MRMGYQVVSLPRSFAVQDGVSKSPSKADDVSHKWFWKESSDLTALLFIYLFIIIIMYLYFQVLAMR